MEHAGTFEDTSTLRSEINRLRNDFQRLKDDLTELGGDALHAAKAGAAETRERVAAKARAATARGRESVEAIEDQVASHPFMSLTAALAVGMLLGFGLSRKD